MNTLKFNLNNKGNKIKILNATNGGPWHKRHATDQFRSNFNDYKIARIPYSRNHDSAVCGIYGGPYSHDITCIFPDFNADPYNPDSYDFACTDESILVSLEAGTETFFRLGQTIEHQIKKHGTIPPKDFKKWAVICEHIIRHYNEGWANGYNLNIKYWEIWNEPDLDTDDSTNKRTWGGTKAEFFDLYEITAKHLKEKFPDLKIGGPALAHNEKWADDFLCEMKKRNVQLDFFSWHIYCTEPKAMTEKAERIKVLLNKYGFKNTESILNEWNYVKGWEEEYVYSLKTIHGIKGASFVMSCLCKAQHAPIDMLMYYDTRPSVFNGVFDFYTYEKLKGYYPFYWYGMLYDCEKEIKAESILENIYSLCGVDKDGKVIVLLTYYSDNNTLQKKSITLDLGKKGNFEIYKVANEHNGELVEITNNLSFDLDLFDMVLIKEK
ncbi:MAG: hypothetical protein J6Q87_06715 [Clostridia bacterium]|nr:hypothetical protein [Clostridia bacterium]